MHDFLRLPNISFEMIEGQNITEIKKQKPEHLKRLADETRESLKSSFDKGVFYIARQKLLK